MLPREYIMRNPDNKIYVVGDIDKLKEDIRLNGVRQPLEVIRWANGYKLIGGERRLTACEELAKEGDTRFLPCPASSWRARAKLTTGSHSLPPTPQPAT